MTRKIFCKLGPRLRSRWWRRLVALSLSLLATQIPHAGLLHGGAGDVARQDDQGEDGDVLGGWRSAVPPRSRRRRQLRLPRAQRTVPPAGFICLLLHPTARCKHSKAGVGKLRPADVYYAARRHVHVRKIFEVLFRVFDSNLFHSSRTLPVGPIQNCGQLRSSHSFILSFIRQQRAKGHLRVAKYKTQ